ncbi:zona pellucida sperm-binding protein 3 receptor-like isoform 1-T1 [Vipera latastei]
MVAFPCNQAGQLAWMLLLLLSSSEVQSECTTPILSPHSSLRGGGDLADTYPVGAVLQLKCAIGYENIPGTFPIMTCLGTSKWSDRPTLCRGRRCPVPHIENGRIVSTNDLRLGEEVTLACDYGFRIMGGSTFQCVLRSGKVEWNRDLPYCERISCAQPPVIVNGRYDPHPLNKYDAGSIVLYQCDADYSLIGKSAIICIVEENGVDGTWDFPPPECKKVKCHGQKIPNGRMQTLFLEAYTYQNKISYECNSGYLLVGSSLVECDANSEWNPPVPRCIKEKSLDDDWIRLKKIGSNSAFPATNRT